MIPVFYYLHLIAAAEGLSSSLPPRDVCIKIYDEALRLGGLVAVVVGDLHRWRRRRGTGTRHSAGPVVRIK